MSKKNFYLHRRTVLKGLGTMIALPMLEAMVPSVARAADPVAKRLGIVTIPNGVVHRTFVPFDPTKLGQALPFNGSISTDLDLLLKNEFAAANLAEYLTLVSGLDNWAGTKFVDGKGSGDGHNGSASLLNCRPLEYGASNHKLPQSMDQIIADSLAAQYPKRYMNFGRRQMTRDLGRVHSASYYSEISWRVDKLAAAKYESAQSAFNELFASQNSDETEARKALQNRHKMDILHFVNEDVRQLKSKLGQADKVILDEYLTNIEEKERDLASDSSASSCDTSSHQHLSESSSVSQYDKWVRHIIDVMFLAFRCDIVPVSVFMTDHAGGYGIGSSEWAGANYKPHDASHFFETSSGGINAGDDPAVVREQYRLITSYYIRRFGDLIVKMKSTPEVKTNGELGNMLDNSIMALVPYVSEAHTHAKTNYPIVVAGTGGGHITPGYHYNFSTRWDSEWGVDRQARHRGKPLANFWLKIMQAMGVNHASFADSDGVITLKG